MRIKKTSNNRPRTSQTINVESNSTTDAYSCDYINERLNGVVLYDNSIGTNADVTLSQNVNNFAYLEIYAYDIFDALIFTKYSVGSAKLLLVNTVSTNGSQIRLTSQSYDVVENTLRLDYKQRVTIFDKTIAEQDAVAELKIVKVIGYK